MPKVEENSDFRKNKNKDRKDQFTEMLVHVQVVDASDDKPRIDEDKEKSLFVVLTISEATAPFFKVTEERTSLQADR